MAEPIVLKRLVDMTHEELLREALRLQGALAAAHLRELELRRDAGPVRERQQTRLDIATVLYGHLLSRSVSTHKEQFAGLARDAFLAAETLLWEYEGFDGAAAARRMRS